MRYIKNLRANYLFQGSRVPTLEPIRLEQCGIRSYTVA